MYVLPVDTHYNVVGENQIASHMDICNRCYYSGFTSCDKAICDNTASVYQLIVFVYGLPMHRFVYMDGK